MSLEAIYNVYKVYCITEGAWVNIAKIETEAAPNYCPNNPSHTINPDSIYIQEKLGEKQPVVIKTNANNTTTGLGNFSDYFKIHGYKLDITTLNGTQIFPISWKKNIYALGFMYQPTIDNIGDSIDVIIAPNTVIGVLSNSNNIGDTVININGVINYIKVGHELLLNGNIVGEVLGINGMAITIDKPLDTSYSQGTFVGFQIRLLQSNYIANANNVNINRNSLAVNAIPANTVCNIIYNNTSNSTKTFHFIIYYLY